MLVKGATDHHLITVDLDDTGRCTIPNGSKPFPIMWEYQFSWQVWNSVWYWYMDVRWYVDLIYTIFDMCVPTLILSDIIHSNLFTRSIQRTEVNWNFALIPTVYSFPSARLCAWFPFHHSACGCILIIWVSSNNLAYSNNTCTSYMRKKCTPLWKSDWIFLPADGRSSDLLTTLQLKCYFSPVPK